MTATIEILTGIAGTGKRSRLLREYRSALWRGLDQRRPGRTLWLAPTSRARRHVLGVLLDGPDDEALPACFAPNVFTFEAFAERILQSTGFSVRRIAGVAKRMLLRRTIDQLLAGRHISYFAGIARTAGFLDLVVAFISELKRDEIWPEQFTQAVAARGESQKDRELALIYQAYQQHLQQESCYDEEGRFWSARTYLKQGHAGPFSQLELVVVDGFTDFTFTQYEILAHLAKSAGRMLVSLPLEEPLERSDLFAKSAAALKRFQRMEAEGLDRERPPKRPHTPVADAASVGADAKTVADAAGIRHDAIARTPDPASPTPSSADAGSIRHDSTGSIRVARSIETAFRSDIPPALQHVSQQLFANPRTVVRRDEAEGIEILAVAGQAGEVEVLAERVKRLLLSGVAPTDVIVAFRSLKDYAELVEEIFAAAGLPFWCEAGLPLSRAPVVRALFGVLQLELEDWPFERLMAVLDSTYFAPNWKEWNYGRGVRAVAAELHRLRLSSGRTTILKSLKRHAKHAEAQQSATENVKETDKNVGWTILSDTTDVDTAPNDQHHDQSDPPSGENVPADVAVAHALLKRLSAALKKLRRPAATFREWSDALLAVGAQLAVAPPDDNDAVPWDERVLFARDRRAWTRCERLLNEAADVDGLFDSEPRTLSLAEFTSELADLLNAQTFLPAASEQGRVRVLEAAQLRSLEGPYLFLAGLTETSFPGSRGDDCLYGEAERRQLNEHGLTLGHQSSHSQDEMLLFYSIVTRARRQLVLSYPAVSASGQPLFSSPYVSALRDLFAPEALPVQYVGQLDPLPEPSRLLTHADLRVAAVMEARRRRPGLFRAMCDAADTAETARNILAALEMAHFRFHESGFTHYEGRLKQPANRQRLSDHYGPEYEFSTTQFELYALCPFRFFLSDVLKITPPPSHEISTDYKSRGTVVHEVLAAIHRQTTGESPPSPGYSPEELARRFRELVEEHLSRRISDSELQRALTEVENRLLAQWADAYGQQWGEYAGLFAESWDEGPLPALFEIPFGDVPGREHDAPEHQYDSIHFGSGANETRVRGRIDRIDVGTRESQPVFNIIDYKTGSPSRLSLDSIRSGRTIQLALYSLAVQRLGIAGDGALPYQMAFWSLKEAGFTPGLKPRGSKPADPLDDAVRSSLETILVDLIPQLAAGIRGGDFSVFSQDENCTGFCPFHTVCRVNQIRPLAESLQKVLERSGE